MAEFDEGRVSSVAIFRRDDGADPSNDVTQYLDVRIREFLSAFQIEGNKTYSHDFISKKDYLEVDINDVGRFDPSLRRLLEDDPATHLPTFEKVASEISNSIHSKENEESSTDTIQIILKSNLNDKALGSSLRSLTSQRISKLVQVPGIIIAAATPKAKATHLTIQCKDCHMTQTLTMRPGLGSMTLPRTCTLSSNNYQIGQKKCSLDPFVILPHRSSFVDQQTLKLQERPEDVPPGDLPRRMMLVTDRHLIDRVTPGTRVVAIGIYSVYEVSSLNQEEAHDWVVFKVVGLHPDDQNSQQSISRITDEEKTKFRNFAQNPEIFEIIHQTLAPEIFGHDIIKQAIACLLFGGIRKRMKDGTYRRGDVNVLLLGDPSTAKSQFLKFTSKVAPIAVYTSGKGSSAAGLTAAVIQDPSTREFYLEGGAMVLADNGVVCIDEFDKMRPEDRVAIHEAMEQQTISIAKAGISTILKSRTSVLAAANPPKGRYDDLKTAQENIDLQTTILSRFDLIFIVKDIRNKQQDTKIAKHVIHHHKTGVSPQTAHSALPVLNQNVDFLRRYVQFCRMESTPRISEAASSILQREYVTMREEARRVAEMGNGVAVPITVRQLEALIRLSESFAKMQLSPEVTPQHVEMAIKLFKVSTMDAVRAGLTEGTEFSQERRVELQRVEHQIKQRLQPNECISESRLVDHLSRMGYEASIVRHAVVMMLRQRDLEQLGSKNILKRLR